MDIKAMDQQILDKEIKRILVLQLGGIGDLVLSTPALKAIRGRFKGVYIGLLVISRSAELIRGSRYIDDLFIFDIYSTNLMSLFRRRAFFQVLRTTQELRQKRFDAIINLENLSSGKGALKMAVLFWLIGAKYRVGRNTDGRGLFLNLKVKDNSQDRRHEVEANLDVARALGANIEEMKLELPVFDEDRIFISNFLTQHHLSDNDLFIGLNPGAFKKSHRWPQQRWARLADRLIEIYNAKIIVIGQNSDAEVINSIMNKMKKTATIAQHFTLKQLSVLIKRFHLFITNDTGPMHIAAAMQTPLIALFGPGDIHKFSPYCSKDKYQILRKEVDCKRPCYIFNCKDLKCMELINVEDVIEAAKKFLG